MAHVRAVYVQAKMLADVDLICIGDCLLKLFVSLSTFVEHRTSWKSTFKIILPQQSDFIIH